MGKPKGKTAKAAKAGSLNLNKEEEFSKAPHSFVFHRGKVGKNVIELEHDLRRVMEPYTARNLKTTKKNVLKDFVSIAGPLNVSHFMVLSKSETSVNLRLVKLPRGPTLTFKVHNYMLAKDIITSLKKPNMEPKQFQHHPLLVMNNMNVDGMHIKLMATMFQNMFPSINVNKVKLKQIRRCVLLNYNDETKELDFRHYNIRAVPVGMSRGVRKLVKATIPNLSKYEDVSEYLLKGDASESEAEMDGPHNEIELPQDMSSRGNIKAAKSAIRLTEIGPRISMQLIKVEEGIAEGKVLFHEFIEKSSEDIKLQEDKREKRKMLKAQRKNAQEQNLLRKKTEKEEVKKKTLAGMKTEDDSDDEIENPEVKVSDSEDDDVKYYEEEVGEAPDKDLFLGKKNFQKRKYTEGNSPHLKKKKVSFDTKNSYKHDGKNTKQPNRKQDSSQIMKHSKSKPNSKNYTRNNAVKSDDKYGKKPFNKKSDDKYGKKPFNKKSDDSKKPFNKKSDDKYGKKPFNKKSDDSKKPFNKKSDDKYGKKPFNKKSDDSKKPFNKKSDDGKKPFNKNKKVMTEMDRMKRSKLKKQQRMAAKKEGKRRNKPRKI